MMGGRRRCCCAADCYIHIDDFDRADSSTIGTGWDERSGDWEISSQQLYEAGTQDALIICTKPNPTSGRAHVSAKISPVNGAKYRIVVKYTDDESFTYVEAHCTTTQLILSAGGETRTYTTADGWDITTRPMTMAAWLDDGFLYVSVTHLGFDGCVWDNTVETDPAARKVGLMNGSTTELWWDDFFFYQHYLDNPLCPDLGCYCTHNGVRHYIAWQLQIDYFSDDCPAGCCCFDGGWAHLEYCCELESWITVDGLVCGHSLPMDHPEIGDDLPIIKCGRDDRCDWWMSQPVCCDANSPASGCTHEGPNFCTDLSADVFQCEPFSVRWNFEVPEADLSCGHCGYGNPGSYYAILTER